VAKLSVTVVAITMIAGVHAMASGGGVGTTSTVRDLVTSGQGRFQVVERKVFRERTEIELVLTDAKGRTIGGYAPPYLQSEEDARQLWKDFVSANLSITATPDQLSVREERKSENETFAVAFALDHSPSMTIPRAIRMQKAVQQALTAFNPNDFVSIVKFTGRVTTEVELTNDRSEYMTNFKVNGLNLRSEGTAIYDAAIEAIEELKGAPQATKRILILFTDGEDNSSSASINDVLELAKSSGTIVHTVVYGVATETPVTLLSAETGGKNFRLNDVYDFDRVFLGIYTALRHSYMLTIDTKTGNDGDAAAGGVLTAAGSSAGSVRSNEMMLLLPRQRVEVSKYSTDEALVMNADLTFHPESGEVSTDDLVLLDSLATVLVQRSDLGLDIVAASGSSANSHIEVEMSQKKVRSIREFLIRRGINPARIQAYANRAASSNPMLQRVASPTKTTLVMTKL
jgi:Mg-chelatase subunit ChlD